MGEAAILKRNGFEVVHAYSDEFILIESINMAYTLLKPNLRFPVILVNRIKRSRNSRQENWSCVM